MANQITNVSFSQPTDPALEMADIARKRKLAEALQAQAAQSNDGGTQVVGGWAIPNSPLQGLGKMAQALSGAYQTSQLDKKEREVAATARTQDRQEREKLIATLTQPAGTPIVADPNAPQPPTWLANAQSSTMNDGMPAGAPPTAPNARPLSNAQRFAAELARSDNPAYAQMGMTSLISALTKDSSPIKVGKDDRLLEPGTYRELVGAATQPKYHVVGGSLVPEPTAGATSPVTPAYTAPKDQWGDPYTLNGQTVQKNAQTGQVRQAVTQPHQVNTNVAVSTDKSYAGHVAAGLAAQDVAAIDAGRSAPQRIQSARAVKDFLDKNPITGTFAEGRLAFEKGLSTAGLIDGERVKNTESLASNLASQTLDAIKTSGLGSGQGFTDKDRQFLERAKSGNIEINSGTLRQLADLNEKAAVTSIQRANTVIKKLKGSKEMGNVGVGLDEIVEPQAPTGANSEVEALLKKYKAPR